MEEAMTLPLTVDISPSLDLRVTRPMTVNIGMDMSIVTGIGVPYTGEYTVIPKANEETVLRTKEKRMLDDVTVTEIPYYETSNTSGTTVYIAGEVEIHGN